MRAQFLCVLTVVTVLVMPSPASAFFESGSTGADGAFSPSCAPTPCTVTVTLPASGVFHYTTVSVPSGVTVKYARNAANTPVTMLATGSVTITGTIDLSGANGATGSGSGTFLGVNRGAGGPGGFDGGNGSNGLLTIQGGNGLGPGGGTGGTWAGGAFRGGGGAGYLTAGQAGQAGTGAGGPTYGTVTMVPLIGGSGGAGGGGVIPWETGGGGGGGGGAILIAAGTSGAAATITLNGSIKAKGGTGWISPSIPPALGGGGSGGAVRLVAENIAGGGSIDVGGGINPFGTGGSGGFGRVRLEAVSYTAAISFSGNPPPSVVSVATAPSAPVLSNHPALTITSIGGVSAPATLTGSFATPDFVLAAGTSSPTVTFAASNIPLGTTLSVVVRGQTGGVISTATSGGLSGTVGSSTASASVTIPTDQASVISATASFTVIADAGGGPIYADGEPVERVVVTAAFDGASQVTYVTASGREFVLAAAR